MFVVYYNVNNKKTSITGDEIEGQIIEIDEDSLILKLKREKVLVYISASAFSIGDIVLIKGTSYTPEEASYKGGFSYKEYLENKGIYVIFKGKEIIKIGNSFCKEIIKDNIYSYYQGKVSEATFDYMKALIFGDYDLDKDIKNDISSIGISHIFQVSGFHINLIVAFLYFLLSKIFKKILLIENIIISFLIFYMVLCGFSISIVRASTMLISGYIFKRYSMNFTKIDILCISILLILFINPRYIYQVGFWLSYLLTFFLIICSSLLRGTNKIKNVIKITILCFFISMPIVININNEINLLSILFTPIFTIIISYIFLPYIYSILLVTNLDKLKISVLFNRLINECSKYRFLVIKFGDINIYLLVIYYVLLIYFLIKIEGKSLKKNSYILALVYFLLIYNINIFNFFVEVTMIDVGQGDSILISLNNNKGNLLIDSSGKNLNYLKDMGIRELDYLIITHSDTDHIGSIEEIKENIKVKNILCSKYDNVINSKKIASGDKFFLSDVKFEVLAPIKEYSNLNNISVVLKVTIYNYTFLFTGDIEEEAELDLVNKYGNSLKCDVLKIPHHGSKSSTSKEFLNVTNPKYSIISVGENNLYSHPSNEVLERLNKTKIYQTAKNGNITFRINEEKMKIVLGKMN